MLALINVITFDVLPLFCLLSFLCMWLVPTPTIED